MQITAQRDTWLKKHPIPAEALAPEFKVFVPIGKTYGLASTGAAQQGHLQVTLASGSGDWWIFRDHWQIDVPADGPGLDGRLYDDRGLSLVAEFEGFREQAYQDCVGIWTVGYGETELDGRPVREGDRLSHGDAEVRLYQRLDQYAAGVRKLLQVPITKGMGDALVSFTYNLGVGALTDSTLLRYLNEGNYIAAAQEFPRWNKAGGQVWSGLTRRRESERQLFLSDGVPGHNPDAPDDHHNFAAPVFKGCHFNWGEVFQWDESRLTDDPLILHRIAKLADVLEEIRKDYGKPLGITSWYRDPATNARLSGAATHSRHLLGDAADCYPVGGDVEDFQRWVQQPGRWTGGIGRGAARGFVHLDLGPARVWDY